MNESDLKGPFKSPWTVAFEKAWKEHADLFEKQRAELDHGWISVQDRLPEANHRVLVIFRGEVKIASQWTPGWSSRPYWEVEGWNLTREHFDQVDLWQELPPPPIGHQ